MIHEREVLLFGAFRDLGSDRMRVPLRRGATAVELRAAIRESLAGKPLAELVSRSAVGTETEILADTAVVPDEGTLALLPPVCGG